MPILLPARFRSLTKDEFRDLDYKVMGHAYECQNELGRLSVEGVYQRDLAARLDAAGLGTARIEQPIVVNHEDFEVRYEIDLLVADAAIFELKTVDSLAVEHEGQLLNYLLLCNPPRGKLVNFRPESVESRFVNSALSDAERRRIQMCTNHWRPISDRCEYLAKMVTDLLSDWGLFLSTSLYTAALTHFLGGEKVLASVPMSRRGIAIDSQPMHLVAPDVAFRVTALSARQSEYEKHLRRLLQFTQLRGLQWINLNRHDVELVTLEK